MMPACSATSKRRKPTITYGRTSRSKFRSFKVFQDAIAIDEKGTAKMNKKHSGTFHLHILPVNLYRMPLAGPL